MIHRILCPTDLSEVANNAAQYACHLGKKTNACVTLFHVRPEFAPLVERSLEDSPLNETKHIIESQCKALSHTFEIKTQAEVDTGIRNFNNLIAHKADHYDLLVVGSNGADSMIQYLFGSNAFNLSIQAKIPTVIIPETFTYKPISRLIYAYDYKTNTEPPFAQLQIFQRLFGSRVTFLTIVENMRMKLKNKWICCKQKFYHAGRNRN